MKRRRFQLAWLPLLLLFLVTACGGTTTTSAQSQPTVAINKKFQAQLSPVPSPSNYRCGTWTSNNAPPPNATIQVYARLTQNIAGIAGATASATVHFKGGDQPLDQQTSDTGGYVTFTLQLQGQQPSKIPATIDVAFQIGSTTIHCATFFTPV